MMMERFWRHRQRGLALFLAPGFIRIHKLPITVPEEVILGSHFHIKPLLPLLDDAGLFWLLTISASGARFFQGSRWNFVEVPGVDLPQGVAEVRAETEYRRIPPRWLGAVLGDDPETGAQRELVELAPHQVANRASNVARRRSSLLANLRSGIFGRSPDGRNPPGRLVGESGCFYERGAPSACLCDA
jgi:hypothetical protein